MPTDKIIIMILYKIINKSKVIIIFITEMISYYRVTESRYPLAFTNKAV